jgi:hypothetical protein
MLLVVLLNAEGIFILRGIHIYTRDLALPFLVSFRITSLLPIMLVNVLIARRELPYSFLGQH